MAAASSQVPVAPLAVDNLRFSREGFHLGPISFTVGQGEVVCLVGTNGSGKTTTLDLVVGALRASVGAITIDGLAPDYQSRDFLGSCGVVHDDPRMVVEELTAREYWRLCAGIRTRDQERRAAWLHTADELAARLDFSPPSATIRSFSHGMRKKTQIVAALMHRPSLIVVDELRNGLDPVAGRRAEMLLEDALTGGAAVLAATHDLFWAERYATRVIVISDGGEVGIGSPAELVLPDESSLEEAFFRLVGIRP